MSLKIEVENIKCAGCAKSITGTLEKHDWVRSARVDVVAGAVQVDCDPAMRPQLVTILAFLGYPEADSLRGGERLKAKAKSFVSCAIGRMK